MAKITEIDGLAGLVRLNVLNMSFNRLTGLRGITQLHGEQYRLRWLDIKGNRIRDRQELAYLAGCSVSDPP